MVAAACVGDWEIKTDKVSTTNYSQNIRNIIYFNHNMTLEKLNKISFFL